MIADVPELVRTALIEVLQSTPSVTDDILSLMARVPWDGDLTRYLDAMSVIAATVFERELLKLDAQLAETRARTAAMEREFRRVCEEFEIFRRMKTASRVH